MTRLAAADVAVEPPLSAASNWGSDIPRTPAVPVCSSTRRVHSGSEDFGSLITGRHFGRLKRREFQAAIVPGQDSCCNY